MQVPFPQPRLLFLSELIEHMKGRWPRDPHSVSSLETRSKMLEVTRVPSEMAPQASGSSRPFRIPCFPLRLINAKVSNKRAAPVCSLKPACRLLPVGEAQSIRRAATRCLCCRSRNCPFLLALPLPNNCPLAILRLAASSNTSPLDRLCNGSATQVILFQGWSGDGLGAFIGSLNLTECKYLILDRAGQSRCRKMGREVLRELG